MMSSSQNACNSDSSSGSSRRVIDINRYFNKKFTFNCEDTWQLPERAFVATKWSISNLQDKKKKLNEVKGQLSAFPLNEWSEYTKHRDPSSFITRYLKQQFHPELLTQAWCKFYECLCEYPLIPSVCLKDDSLTSLHLCEAPGAFIAALNHYIQSNELTFQWNWLASTLNPYYEGNSLNEMIPDDRLIQFTPERWLFGYDLTGDIRQYCNHRNIVEQIAETEKVMLITADGSVDCILNPGEQEVYVEHLHFCELVTALSVLHEGGTFVIKMFTFFEDSSVCFLYLLNCSFRNVHVFKPSSSKSGNSEVYVICINFKGLKTLQNIWNDLLSAYKSPDLKTNKSLFDLNEIDCEFIKQVSDCADLFMERQIETIEDNIRNFQNKNKIEVEKVKVTKRLVADRYIKKYKLKYIPREKKLVPVDDDLGCLSCYFRQWNYTSGWIYANDFLEFDTSIAICNQKVCELLTIRLGKPIDKVLHSNFCSKRHRKLSASDFQGEDFSYLMEVVQSVADIDDNVLSVTDYSNKKQHEFHLSLFYDIKERLHKNQLVFIKIPFTTSFLVSMLYLLMFHYEKAIFYKSGFIVLKNLTARAEEVNECFEFINSVFNDLHNCDENDKKLDIIQVLLIMILNCRRFINPIWNYNNVVSA